MASAQYKGITIKFGADTTTISKAMKEIDTEARELKNNLNTVNKNLKFDSDNPGLLAQKFSLLNEQIENTKTRLGMLIEYEKKAKELFESGNISKSQYTSLTREIERAKNELKGLNAEAKATFDNLKTSILGAKEKLSDFTKAALAAGAALAVNELKKLGSAAIETASDLREVQNVVDTSFGDLAYKMEDLADKAIETYGISKLTAKQTGSTFMAMADGMEIIPEVASDMSIALTELSADMASFYNVEQQAAATALNSVFTGETETLKKFGIVMTEANLNAYAMEQGIEKTVKQMSQAEKVQLRYNYVMEQTSLVQGDFAKTSGEWANRSRVLKEEITELSSMVGEELINNLGDVQGKASQLFDLVRNAKESGQLSAVIKDVSDGINKLLDIFVRAVEFIYKYRSEIATTVEVMIAFKAALKISQTITSLITFIGSLKAAMTALTASTEAQTVAQTALNASMNINPVVALITAVTMLATVISTKLYKATIEANEEFLKMGEAEEAAREAADAVSEFVNSIETSSKASADNVAAIESEYGGYQRLADTLYNLSEKQNKTADDYARINTLIEQLNEKIPGLGLSFDEATGKLSMQRDELTSLINDYERYYKTLALQDSLTQMYKDQYEAEQKLAEAKEADRKALEAFTAAEEDYNNKKSLFENAERNRNVSSKEYDRLKDEMEAAKDVLDQASLARNTTRQSLNEISAAYSKLGRDISTATDYISESADVMDSIGPRVENALEALAYANRTVEEITDAYDSAKDAVGDYASELSKLADIQKDIAEGNELSTLDMLDLIEKYPELISYIKETENGYILENEALEKLIETRVKAMKLAASEQLKNAEALFSANDGDKTLLEKLTSQLDSGKLTNIAKYQAEEYTQGLYEYLNAYSYSKGIDHVLSDILSGGLKEGSSKSESTSSAISDAAAQAFKVLEHQHNMGLKSDEEYYNELEKLNNQYYKNSAETLDKYWSYEERIYAYRKKAAEELAKAQEKNLESNAKSLENLKNKINDVIDARKELEGIKSNKSVLAYNEATGFSLEVDQSKLKQAYEKVSKAQDNLIIDKLGLGKTNSEVIANIKDMVSSLEKVGIKNFLPDLKQAYAELARVNSTTTTNNQYITQNFGDIITKGSADDFKAMLKEFMEEVIKLKGG